MKKFVLLLLAISLVGCKAEIGKVFESTDEFTVLIYQDGRAVKEYKLLKGTEKFNQLMQWAITNEKGWEITPASYVPGVLVSGGGYSFNFLGESVIVNYESKQYAKNIKKNEYSFLK